MAESQMSSSKASSSALSTASSAAAVTVSEAISQQLVPSLSALDAPWPTPLTIIGLALEHIQMLSLLISSAWAWSSTMRGLGVPIYFTLLPFWDQRYAPGIRAETFTDFQAYYWVAAGLVLLSVFTFGLHSVGQSTRTFGWATKVTTVTLFAFGSWLFQPLLHVLLAGMVCDPDTSPTPPAVRGLAAFPSQECYSGAATAMFVVGTICVPLLVMHRFFVMCLMVPDAPNTIAIRGRPGSGLDTMVLTAQLLSAVLYHTMLPAGLHQAFAGIQAFVYGVLIVYTIINMPYFYQWLNRATVASYMVGLWTAVQVCVMYSLDSERTVSSPTAGGARVEKYSPYDAAFWIAGVVISAVVGIHLANIRVSRHFLRALSLATEGDAYEAEDPRFPNGLPQEERTKLIEIEGYLFAQRRQAELQRDADAKKSKSNEAAFAAETFREEVSVLQPYVDAVYQASDVELAGRFIRNYEHAFRSKATFQMVIFGLRIISKGSARFPVSVFLNLHMAYFIATHIPTRAQDVATIMLQFQRDVIVDGGASVMDALDLGLAYRIARRSGEISGSVMMRDTSQKRVFVAAQRLHREALQNMGMFWAHLLDDHTDVSHLAGLAKTITDKREDGLANYHRVCHDRADQAVLVRYAQFLEQVMLDTEGSDQMRDYIVDVIEQAELNRGGEMAARGFQHLIERQVNKANAQSSNISMLRAVLVVLFLLSACLVIGFIVFGAVYTSQSSVLLDRLQAAGIARDQTQQAVVLSQQLQQAVAGSASTNATEIQGAILALVSSFRQTHFDLTVGKYALDDGSSLADLNIASMRELYSSDTRHTTTFTTASLWTLGSVLVATLERLARADVTTATGATQVREDIDFVRLNALDPIGAAMNASVEHLVSGADDHSATAHIVLSALAIGSLLACAATYTVLIFNFSAINTTKLSTLSLFTLIPKATVGRLRQQTAAILEKFDVPDAALEEKMLAKGLATEQQERTALMASARGVPPRAQAERSAQLAEANAANEAEGAQSQKQNPASFSALKGANAKRADGKILRTRLKAVSSKSDNGAEDVGVLLEDHSLFDFETMEGLERAEQDSQHAWQESAAEERGATANAQLQGLGDDHVDTVALQDAPTAGASTAGKALGPTALSSSAVFRGLALMAVLIILAAACLIVAGVHYSLHAQYDERKLRLHRTINSAAELRVEAMDAAARFVAQPTASLHFGQFLQASEANDAQAAGLETALGDSVDMLNTVYESNIAWMEYRKVARIAVALACTAASGPALRLSLEQRQQPAIVPPEPAAPALHPLWSVTQAAISGSAAPQQLVGVCPASNDDFVAAATWEPASAPAMLLSALAELGSSVNRSRFQSSATAFADASSEEQLTVAVGVLASATIEEDARQRAIARLGRVADFVRSGVDTGAADTAQFVEGFASTSIAAAGCVVLIAAIAVALHARLSSVVTVANCSLLGVAVALALAMIPMASLIIHNGNEHAFLAQEESALLAAVNSTRSNIYADKSYAFRSVIGLRSDATRKFDLRNMQQVVEQQVVGLVQLAGRDQIIAASAPLAAMQRWQFVARVGMSLTDDLTVPTTASVRTQWNFTGELGAFTVQLDYPSQVFYTNRVEDLALPQLGRRRLAWNLLAGPYADALKSDAVTGVVDIAEKKVADIVEEIDVHNDEAFAVTVGGAVCGVIGLLVVAGLSQSIALGLIGTSRGTAGAGSSSAAPAEGANQGGSKDVLFDSLSLRSRGALVVTVVAIALVYVVGEVMLTRNRAKSLDAASLRQSLTWRQLAFTQMMPARSVSGRAVVAEAIDKSDRAVAELYFGAAGEDSSIAVPALWHDVGESIFGTAKPSDEARSCADPTAAASQHNTSMDAMLAASVDTALRSWRSRVALIALTTNDTSTFDSRLRDLQEDATLLLPRVRETTKNVYDEAKTEVDTGRIAFLTLAALALLCVIVVFVMVFRPMLAELMHEEEGTKLMLKMIPEDVRQSVPAIAEYLRRGVILQDTKVQSINEAMSEMSTLPTIAIDFRGTILRFSRAAEETFLYSKDEVVGKNIKMLMPNAIAAEHDTYLDNYYRTGVKHVIGRPRRVRGQKKDGSVFPVEINVKEIKTGATTTFVGTLRDVAVDVEFERTTALSKAVSEVAPLPIIVINEKGIVKHFNRAAEKLFDYSENEVVDSNVSRLMLDGDAAKHDFYLERYRSTRVARVVGKTRAVRCRRRTGGIFIGLLSVVELRQDNGTMFIGYCSDCTEKIETDIATTLGEAIATTSPVPLVSIDTQGTVESWNPAAARVFRTPAADIIGRNIKQIMPEAVAQKHDVYLTSYLRTGKKTMLDRSTAVKARRPAANSTSFEQFPATLTVMEVTRSGGAKSYVAYMRDDSRTSEIALNSKIARSIRQMSLYPIILISPEGIVKGYSPASEELFGYTADEVMGKNVKMLMPESIAVQHDGFLSRYMETKVKHVIGTTRRATAQRKNGTTVPVELSIRETVYAGEYTFVGFIRSVEMEVEHLQQNAINDAVARLSTLPVLAMDMSGTVLSCSDSACVTFDWPREELLGQNIKVLMPDSFANAHDGYLETYATRLEEQGQERARATSTIINRNRRVIGKRRDELTFPAEVCVRDLHINGLPTVFVGTVRDITDDLEKSSQTTFASTIIETSSIPFITIDRMGTVLVFSAAAEVEWGYTKAEVVGKNIKMLMPDEIAINHDGYLRAYAKTGVKSVIDSTRRVNGKAKDGTIFPIEINIREVVHTDATGKSTSEYVGFARSLKQEHILQQAAEINKVTAELVSTPVIMIDEIGTIVEFNPPAAEVFGYTQSEAIGQNIKMLTPAEIAAQHDGFLAAYKKTGVKHVIDTTRHLNARRKDGTLFPAELSIREVKLPGRDEKQFLGYVRDLTDIKRVEELAIINKAIIDVAPTALIVMDRVGTVSVFSRAAESTFGWDAADVFGQNVKMLMPEEIATNHDFFLARYVQDGVKRVVDTTRYVTGMRKNGSRFDAKITVVEIEVNGEINYVGYVADETERIKAEDEVQMADFFQQTSPVPVISIKHDGELIAFSPAAEQLFGYTKAEVIGKNIKMLQPPEIAAKHDEYLAAYLRTGNAHIIGTTRKVEGMKKDGTKFPMKVRVSEVRPDPKKPPTYIGYAWSIEDELRVQNASIESQTLLVESPTPIIVITALGIITEVNNAALRAFGYDKPSDLLDKNVKMLTPDEIAREHDGYLKRYMDTKEAHVVGTSRRLMGKQRDGRLVPMQLFLREVSVEGLDTQFIGAVQPLEESERIAAEIELGRAIAELSTNGLIIMNPMGTVSRYSASASRITGFTADEVVGQNIKMITPPHIAKDHDGFLARFRQTGERHVVGSVRKVQGLHKNGRMYAAQIGVEEVETSEGKVYAGFLENLEGGMNVAMSSEINAVMLDLAVHAIIIIDEVGTIEEINRAGLRLFGLGSAEEVLGKNVKCLMPEEIASQHDGYLERYRRTGEKHVIDTTRRAVARNLETGAAINIELSIRELHAIGNKARRFMGYVRDIADELRLDVARRTGDAMMELSKYAIVVIDTIGTIVKFSMAAEKLFGCDAQVAIGKNVKMLMPDSVAVYHDGYLETYRRTGRKSVIDRQKDVMAIKYGTTQQFMVTLQVKELTFDAKGLENVYVAFIEETDTSKQVSRPTAARRR